MYCHKCGEDTMEIVALEGPLYAQCPCGGIMFTNDAATWDGDYCARCRNHSAVTQDGYTFTLSDAVASTAGKSLGQTAKVDGFCTFCGVQFSSLIEVPHRHPHPKGKEIPLTTIREDEDIIHLDQWLHMVGLPTKEFVEAIIAKGVILQSWSIHGEGLFLISGAPTAACSQTPLDQLADLLSSLPHIRWTIYKDYYGRYEGKYKEQVKFQLFKDDRGYFLSC